MIQVKAKRARRRERARSRAFRAWLRDWCRSEGQAIGSVLTVEAYDSVMETVRQQIFKQTTVEGFVRVKDNRITAIGIRERLEQDNVT